MLNIKQPLKPLTVNFKYKYFRNFGHGFFFKCVSLHTPIVGMIWSLIPHVEQPSLPPNMPYALAPLKNDVGVYAP